MTFPRAQELSIGPSGEDRRAQGALNLRSRPQAGPAADSSGEKKPVPRLDHLAGLAISPITRRKYQSAGPTLRGSSLPIPYPRRGRCGCERLFWELNLAENLAKQ